MAEKSHIPSAAATLGIDVLKMLVAIAETGSLTAAAGRVSRSPGAISMQIKKLEDTLGRDLFQRSRQGMELTTDGERLIAYARRILDIHGEALDAFRAPQLTGEVRLGTVEFGGMRRLSPVLAAFARSYPRVAVDVVMGPSAELAPKLEQGRLDLAVLAPGYNVPWRSTDHILVQEPLLWVGREGGRAARTRPLPLALSAIGCGWRRAALEALELARIPYRVVYTSEFYEAHKAAVHADLAIALLPRSRLEPGLAPVRAAEGLPDVGTCRIALRLSSDPSPATPALAERIAESYDSQLSLRAAS